MDWQQLLVKLLIGGVTGAAAKLAVLSGLINWNTLWAAIAGGFLLGLLNVLNQWFAPEAPALVGAKKVGFWSKLKKSL